jgi:hypothetical protein
MYKENKKNASEENTEEGFYFYMRTKQRDATIGP